MIDLDGDGQITYDEFMSAAKNAIEDEQAAVDRTGAGVRDVLQRVSDYMRKNRVRLGQGVRGRALCIHAGVGGSWARQG